MAASQNLIESSQRLSDSSLWEIQENYFSTKGVAVWQNDVPYFISSNAFICSRYANLVTSMIQDLMKHKPPKGPLHIIEIGAGHGKFSFYFLKAFESSLKSLGLEHFDYQYVITDVAGSNVDFCQSNLALQPYIEAKKLDFAVFDVRKQKDFDLRLTAKPFSQSQSKWPVVYICNYVFDLLPHDAFKVEGESISEYQVELHSRFPVFDTKNPKRIKDLQLKPFYRQVELEGYYEEPKHTSILANYRRHFEKKGFFSFPIGAMRFTDTIRALSPQSIILCGDKGITLQENLGTMTEEALYTFDGCFAFTVNFHALGQYVKGQEGDYLPSQHQNFYNVALFAQGMNFDDLPVMRTYFTQDMEYFGADEFCFMNDELAYNGYRFSLKSCLSVLRMSHYDPDTYYHVHDKFIQQFETMNAAMVKDVSYALAQVESNLYYDRAHHEAFSLLGNFYLKANVFQKAEELFNQALKHAKKPFEAYRSLGMLYEKRGNSNRAIEYYKKALHLNAKDKFSKFRIQSLEGSPMTIVKPLMKALLVTGACALLVYLAIHY